MVFTEIAMNIPVSSLKKLQRLLNTIRINIKEFDDFLANTPHIYRSIKGHAFEVWFDRVMRERGVKVNSIGGDSVVDRVINGKTLQLKTPYLKATAAPKVFGYRMHKTHGAEVKPHCYYKKNEFADYLVGLHPTQGVIICPRKYLPTRGEVSKRLDYPEYLADPLPFEWNTKWLNRYDLLGIKVKNNPTLAVHSESEAKYFPKLIEKIGFTDYDIIHSIIDNKNFRIWFQLIVGTIRELHFSEFARLHKITLNPPKKLKGRGSNKVDYVLDNGSRIQVKGLTKGMCSNKFLGCETQCSHGRVPNRLYRRSDFDFIVIVIDPGIIPVEKAKKLKIISKDYNFVILPISKLPRHPRSKEWGNDYIKSSFLFRPEDVTYNNFELLA